MKTFNQFQENVAAIKGASYALPLIFTGIGAAGTLYQATKGDGESNFEKLRKMREKGEGKDLEQKTKEDAKKPRTREKIQNALVDAGLRYRKGLSVRPEDVKGKKYRTDEMKGKSPADFVRELLKKQGREYKRQRIKNKKIDRDLGK